MPLFNENTENVAMAIVTLQRALEYKVIEENYKGLVEYLNNQKTVYGINETHLKEAEAGLDEELEGAELELMKDIGDQLYEMAEELLAEHERDFGKTDDEMLREEEEAERDRQLCAKAQREFLARA